MYNWITLIILDGRDRWLGGKAESDSYRHRSSSPERYRAGPGHGGGAGGVASHRSRLVVQQVAQSPRRQLW